MAKKVKKKSAKKTTGREPVDGLVFRSGKLKDFNLQPRHPRPIPGYKATLPGPPGWQVKQDPGA